jgi:DNA processing protein
MKLTAEQRDWLALALVPGVGSAHFIRLLARFHSPAEVLRASENALREVVGPSLAQRVYQYKDAVDVEEQIRAMEKCGATFITLEDSHYPLHLAEIYDPPLVLFCRGHLREKDARAVAIVGTRRATPYGLHMAEKLGRELAAHHLTVVSGMAAGIDAAAHQGAMSVGGRTIAVLGCGVDVVYPPQHATLLEEIAEHGCVVSQFPMGMQPLKGNFPYRNRIISGLSVGTVVVEAPIQSGALITARQAAEQGREVFAVPGQAGLHTSAGPHSLIRQGAKLVESAEDILYELNLPEELSEALAEVDTADALSSVMPDLPTPPPVENESVPVVPASSVEQRILGCLSQNGSFVDEIASKCRISVSEALSSLTLLELKGLIRQFSGKRFAPR